MGRGGWRLALDSSPDREITPPEPVAGFGSHEIESSPAATEQINPSSQSVLICNESVFHSSEILLCGVSVMCLSAAAVHLSNWISPPQNNDPLLHPGPR